MVVDAEGTDRGQEVRSGAALLRDTARIEELAAEVHRDAGEHQPGMRRRSRRAVSTTWSRGIPNLLPRVPVEMKGWVSTVTSG